MLWLDCPQHPSLCLCPTAASRPEKYESWRYDPRFTGSFDEDPEPPRDPYREDVDRRSEHSEHSARSLGASSRRSSFSAHSQQSQVYRSRTVTTGPFEAPPPPGSLHGDYAYGSNFSSVQGFPEFGYPADASWAAMDQGVCSRALCAGPCRAASHACDRGGAVAVRGTGSGLA